MSLKSFSVRNFRCLADVELHNFARINLLVGDNDTGKTALLEALFAHLSQGNAINLTNLKAFRRSAAVLGEAFWLDLFNGFDDKKQIQLVSVDHAGKQRHSTFMVGETAHISIDVPQENTEKGIDASLSFRPLRVTYSDSDVDKPFANEVYAERQRLVQKERFNPDLKGYYFSTAGPPDIETIATHVSELFVQKQESALLNLAKIIDERILKLTPASPKGSNEVFVDLGEPQLVPLTLMGSGVVRALGIAAALPHFSGGVVLIDEVDAGIYFKRFKELWNALTQLAKNYDVQIFASTHSAECVNAAAESVAPDLKDTDPLHVYRLIRGKRLPVPYEGKSLKSVMEFMAEVR